MPEREVIPVVCVYAAGEDDGYPHLEGLFNLIRQKSSTSKVGDEGGSG